LIESVAIFDRAALFTPDMPAPTMHMDAPKREAAAANAIASNVTKINLGVLDRNRATTFGVDVLAV
jgi:hypothetical protein